MPDPRYLNDPEEESEPWFESIQANDQEEALLVLSRLG